MSRRTKSGPINLLSLEEISAVRRHLLEGHAVILAVSATTIAWIVSPEVALAFWDDRPLHHFQHISISNALNTMLEKGWRFPCLKRPKLNKPMGYTPSSQAA